MAAKYFSTLLLGVVIIGGTMAEENLQSQSVQVHGQPMRNQENIASVEPMTSQENAGVRPIATPEVVLQLKYDGGELNRIYLTQFRKGVTTLASSVPAKVELCADLCHAGLGGDTCGDTCSDMIPVGLQSALMEHNGSTVSVMHGQPRVLVCPTLCQYGLGQPLCGCEGLATADIDWKMICNAFCVSGGYKLRSCPQCEDSSAPIAAFATRVLNTVEGWSSWCNVQCVQGHGGAACNCNSSPFL